MPSVFPTFRYPDARAAIDFLCSAFGFTEHAVHERDGVAAGAEITRELVDQDYGSREYAAKDPAGNVWAFGTYRPS